MKKKKKKNSIRQKILWISSLLTAFWLLSGFASFGKSPVELKTDQPLIDLDLLVQDSLPGQYGNQESGLEGATEETNPEGEETKPEEPVDAEGTEAGLTPVTQIRVVVNGKNLTVNRKACKDAGEMLEQVKALYRVGLKVCLVDDYADYTAYMEAYDLLREQKISLTEEQAE